MTRSSAGRLRFGCAMLLTAGLCLLIAETTLAQTVRTNLAVLQHLAEHCLGDVPADADTVLIEGAESMPYLASAVASSLQDQGKAVYLSTDDPVKLPVLSWVVETAGVQYARADSKSIQRTVRLELQYMFVDSDGKVLQSGPCSNSFADTVPRAELAALETAAFPETQAEPPSGNWMRRYLEPVVLAVATGLAAFLFFNLRSDRADS